MLRTALVAAMLATVSLPATAAEPPMPFSFVPHIYQSDTVDPRCHTPLGAGWFNYLTTRHTVTSTFPAYLGVYKDKMFYTGPVCIQFTSPDPRFPTGRVLLWVWGRGLSNNIFAHGHEVQCRQNTMARRWYGYGRTVDDVIRTTAAVQDATVAIANDPGGAYAVSVCRLLEMFYPGRGAWYDYPQ